MRVVNFLNLMIVIGAAFFTWNAIAAEPMRVHVMQNLTPAEAQIINQGLVKLGYKPSQKALFSESSNAIIITKALPNENEGASLTIELVHLDHANEMPKVLFQYSLAGNDVSAVIKAVPKPEAFNEPTELMPVASLNSEP
jgi:hypothetical protein